MHSIPTLAVLALVLAGTTHATSNNYVKLHTCLSSAKVKTLVPGDPNYPIASQAFNQRFDWQPAAIAYPSNVNGVSAAVKCGAQYSIPIVARGGGHSYVAYSLGGQDGSLVIDLQKFDQVVVNKATGTAVIGAGNRLGDVALGLYEQGHRALPHGTCPQVGIGGHAAFGGYGLDSRAWGLTLDRIISHQVVLANGTIATTSATQHADLFWALRGAGASFGIITAYTMKTFAAPPSNVLFNLPFDLDVADATSAFLAYQHFGATNCPAAMSMEIDMGAGSKLGRVDFEIAGAFMGSLEEYKKAIAPLLKDLPTKPTKPTAKAYAWVPSLEALGGVKSLNTTGVKDNFNDTRITTHHQKAAQAFFTYLAYDGFKSNTSWFVQAELYGGKNSAINAVRADATSYAQRGRLLNFQLYASSSNYKPPYPSKGIHFVQGMRNALVDNMPKNWDYGAYANYDEDDFTNKQWQQQYFGDHYPRLVTVKTKYDSHQVFKFPQSIGVS